MRGARRRIFYWISLVVVAVLLYPPWVQVHCQSGMLSDRAYAPLWDTPFNGCSRIDITRLFMTLLVVALLGAIAFVAAGNSNGKTSS